MGIVEGARCLYIRLIIGLRTRDYHEFLILQHPLRGNGERLVTQFGFFNVT